jgi:uncharacterized membrane protein YdjX (TVP38/TMEM64 family)
MWLKAAAILVSLIVSWCFRETFADFLRVVGDREAVIASLQQFGTLGPTLLGVILILQVIVAAIPGHALMVGGGYVYGFGVAFCINLVATVGGSQAAFLLARWAGRPVVERLAPAAVLDKWNKTSVEKGLAFFLFAYMLPVFPADVMNYVAALSSLSGRRFFIANLFGRLPGVLLMTVIGAFGVQLSGQTWLLILFAAVVMFAAWRLLIARKPTDRNAPQGHGNE